MLMSHFSVRYLSSTYHIQWYISTMSIHFITPFVILGNNKKKGAGSKAGETQAAPIVDKDDLRDIRKKTEKGQKSDAIVIT